MLHVDQLLQKLSIISDPVAQRTAAFKYVRDIPYGTDGAHDLDDAFLNFKGNCHFKSRLLAILMNCLGNETRFLIAEYILPDFPAEVRYIPSRTDYHHAVEIMINKKWVLVDPTYDPPLHVLGFQVNEWDGLSNTALAEKPLSTKRTDEKNIEFDVRFSQFEQRMIQAEINYPHQLQAYSEKFNAILDKVREMNY